MGVGVMIWCASLWACVGVSASMLTHPPTFTSSSLPSNTLDGDALRLRDLGLATMAMAKEVAL